MFCRYRSLLVQCCRALVSGAFKAKEDVLHIHSAQSLVDGPGLHVRHGCELHLICDGVDNIGMDKSSCSKFLELCDEFILLCALLCLLCCNLLPLCAVVEASGGDIG